MVDLKFNFIEAMVHEGKVRLYALKIRGLLLLLNVFDSTKNYGETHRNKAENML